MERPAPGSPAQQVAGEVASRLRYPWAFGLLLAALAVDFVVPDPIPFLDELVLALLTVVFGAWRTRRSVPEGSPPGQ